jgi:hypothetical protein
VLALVLAGCSAGTSSAPPTTAAAVTAKTGLICMNTAGKGSFELAHEGLDGRLARASRREPRRRREVNSASGEKRFEPLTGSLGPPSSVAPGQPAIAQRATPGSS